MIHRTKNLCNFKANQLKPIFHRKPLCFAYVQHFIHLAYSINLLCASDRFRESLTFKGITRVEYVNRADLSGQWRVELPNSRPGGLVHHSNGEGKTRACRSASRSSPGQSLW